MATAASVSPLHPWRPEGLDLKSRRRSKMNTLFQNIPTTESVRKVGPGEGEKFDVGGAHLTFVWITIAATGTKKPVFESLGSSILN
jgi:hypothetical protein